MKFRKEAEERYRLELDAELQRYKKYELSEMRAQEADLFTEKLRKHKMELEKLYKEKLKRVKEREKQALDLVKRRTEELEKLSFE